MESLQGTILQEHWRVAFRRRYFTVGRLCSRDAILRFYNHGRPHHSYRLRDQTSAAQFWDAAKA